MSEQQNDLREKNSSLLARLKAALVGRAEDGNLRDALEEYVEGIDGNGSETAAERHERILISNILQIRDKSVADVMVPRADIVGIDVHASSEDLLSLLAERQYSRLPVYRDSLDDVLGTIHIKDILAALAQGKKLDIRGMTRDVPIVSPAMPALDLLLQMRQTRKHLVLVVDEYGGIDGLVTIGDVIESIVGDIDDEFDPDSQPSLEMNSDGSLIADARYDIENFEARFGDILTEEERDDVDTLGGLIFSMAGRVPSRGEVLTHKSGAVFEIVESDQRRVKRIRIQELPHTSKNDDNAK